eukprot:jgi/Psemu1/31572/gm1.31572_g
MKFPPNAFFIQLMITKIAKLGNNDQIPKIMNVHAPNIHIFIISNSIAFLTLTHKQEKEQTYTRYFPATVLITENENVNSEHRYKLHKDYRCKNSPEFQYFVKRILGAVLTDVKRKLFQTTLSNIFTPSNEALALLFLYNDYDLWINTTKGTRKRKKFIGSKPGNKEGWSTQGQILYRYILNEIEKQREEQQSKDLEIELPKTYQQQNGKHTAQDDKDKVNKKEQRIKEIKQCDIIETLGKDDKDYKYYITYTKSLQKEMLSIIPLFVRRKLYLDIIGEGGIATVCESRHSRVLKAILESQFARVHIALFPNQDQDHQTHTAQPSNGQREEAKAAEGEIAWHQKEHDSQGKMVSLKFVCDREGNIYWDVVNGSTIPIDASVKTGSIFQFSGRERVYPDYTVPSTLAPQVHRIARRKLQVNLFYNEDIDVYDDGQPAYNSKNVKNTIPNQDDHRNHLISAIRHQIPIDDYPPMHPTPTYAPQLQSPVPHLHLQPLECSNFPANN